MPSKRDGLTQPSVTSQPPRLTARTRGRRAAPASASVLPASADWSRGHDEQMTRRRSGRSLMVLMTTTSRMVTKLTNQLAAAEPDHAQPTIYRRGGASLCFAVAG